MANVFDVAKYILLKCEKKLPITTWKLQKLAYYSQAWSLVWEDKPLFQERIEAWANGPVCPQLYEEHKGLFKIAELKPGRISALSRSQKVTIEKVVTYYGKFDPQYLSELTHAERPWKEARKGMEPRRFVGIRKLASM